MWLRKENTKLCSRGDRLLDLDLDQTVQAQLNYWQAM